MALARDAFKYGAPQMILLHDQPQIKYPTEVLACQHAYNPNDAQFIPAPIGPLRLWCPGCQALQPAETFSPCADRPTGRRGYCKPCERQRRKSRRAKKHHESLQERWYRGA